MLDPSTMSTTNDTEHIIQNSHFHKIIINNNKNDSGFSVLSNQSPQSLPQVVVNGVQRPITIMDLGKLLLQASRDGNISKVRELVNRGAPFSSDWLGTSPLHLAAKNNHLDTCALLLKASICKDVKNKVDRTPLHVAAYEGHYKVVELLLLNKVEVDPRDMLKMTPLHWAVEREFTNIVQILLSHGADPHAISKFRKTPYSLAQAHNNVQILKLLATATQLHESNLKQTQKATDSLVSEMKRFQKPKTSDPNPDSYEHMVDQDTSSMQMPMDDYDGGNRLNEAIVHLQNVDAPSKSLDSSALQILQDHGISLQEEQDSSMLTSALQSGRKLVLSEAGKLGLKMPIITASGSLVQRSVKLATNRFHPYTTASGSLITSTPTTGNQQTNKIVKILSAEEFKQMCGGDLATAFRKTPSQEIKKVDDGHVKMHVNNNNGASTESRVAKRPIFPKTKNTIEMQKLLSNAAMKLESVRSEGLADNQTSSNNEITNNNQIHGNTLIRDQNRSGKRIEIISQQRIVPGNNQSKTTTSLNMLEVEKQLIELRKQTEDLRKQLEMTQQQNEEYRLRLERIEKELESYRDEELPHPG